MAQDKVASLYDWIFRKLRYYSVYSSEATDALLAAEFAEILAVDTDGKADKVAGATEDNFASLDDTGNLQDSGYSAANFASVSHTHDTRYTRLNASVVWDVTLGLGQTWTWSVNTEAPFAISNGSGDTLGVVTHLNADLLDGQHASEFAPAVHTHSKYALKGAAETITGPWTFSSNPPFALSGSAVNALVTGLNADKLDGNDASAFALASHSHGDIYYTEDEIDTMIGLLLAKPTTGTTDGGILVYNDPIVQTSAVDLSDIALLTDIAAKYDEVAGVNGNLVAFATSGTTLVDSGSAPSDFAAASHNHDDRYYTETELTNSTTNLSLASLTIGGSLVLTENVAAGAEAGTISNVPTAGNPAVFFSIFDGATEYAVPGWAVP